jgi:hypothetical protein
MKAGHASADPRFICIHNRARSSLILENIECHPRFPFLAPASIPQIAFLRSFGLGFSSLADCFRLPKAQFSLAGAVGQNFADYAST